MRVVQFIWPPLGCIDALNICCKYTNILLKLIQLETVLGLLVALRNLISYYIICMMCSIGRRFISIANVIYQAWFCSSISGLISYTTGIFCSTSRGELVVIIDICICGRRTTQPDGPQARSNIYLILR